MCKVWNHKLHTVAGCEMRICEQSPQEIVWQRRLTQKQSALIIVIIIIKILIIAFHTQL